MVLQFSFQALLLLVSHIYTQLYSTYPHHKLKKIQIEGDETHFSTVMVSIEREIIITTEYNTCIRESSYFSFSFTDKFVFVYHIFVESVFENLRKLVFPFFLDNLKQNTIYNFSKFCTTRTWFEQGTLINPNLPSFFLVSFWYQTGPLQ